MWTKVPRSPCAPCARRSAKEPCRTIKSSSTADYASCGNAMDGGIPSNADDRTLPVGTYRLEKKGWHPGLGEREKEDGISNGKRRRVIERDGRRCVVCGVGSGEPYV